MKQRFLIAFALLFALFATGVGTSSFLLWRSSSELRELVAMHQVGELRQVLGQRLQKSQNDLEVSGTVFANQLDSIIENVQALDESVQTCFSCHHQPDLQQDLDRMVALAERYKIQYSTFITAFLNSEQRQSLQLEAAATADELEILIDDLLFLASAAMKERSDEMLAEIRRSWQVLAGTLALTLLVAALVASALVRSITRPVEKLVAATGHISKGDLGHQVEHREKHEMGALMEAFNAMSGTLASDKKRIDGYVGRLKELIQAVFSLHATPDPAALRARLASAMENLVEAELYGSVLKADVENVFVISLRSAGQPDPLFHGAIPGAKLGHIRADVGQSPFLVGNEEVPEWPFGTCDLEAPPRNFLVCWIEFEGELMGGLIVVNKLAGDFVEEDCELLGALGSGVAEAVQNIHLYQELRTEIETLQTTP